MERYLHPSALTVVRERAAARIASRRRRSTRVRGYVIPAEVA